MGEKDGNTRPANPSNSNRFILQKNDRDTKSILLKDLEIPPLSAPLSEASLRSVAHADYGTLTL